MTSRNKAFLLAAIWILALLVHPAICSHAQPVETLVVYSLDFASADETVKHLDNETENYDSYDDGSARGYVDNGIYVFEGNNTNTQGLYYDEPLAVVKGYNEPNELGSYAVLPYNYSVSADFMVPDTPGYGNFFILPRYSNVSNKYEIVVDTEWSSLVFNYVKNDTWHSLKSSWIGFTIQENHWYRLEVNITWEYNEGLDKYMNHIVARVTDLSDTSNYYQDEVWDDNLPPDTYNGLAFLGFDDDKEFKVYMDNVVVMTEVEEVGREPAESVSPGDLNFTSMYMWNDTSILYIYMGVSQPLSPDTSSTKYWVAQLDVDMDSRTSSSFDPDFIVVVSLTSTGDMRGDLYTESGTWIERLHILGGGVGKNYIVIEVEKSSLTGLGGGLYLTGYSQLGSSVVDEYPVAGSVEGEYAVYFLDKPAPVSGWSSITDPEGDASPGEYDIAGLASAYSGDYLFINFTVDGLYHWSGGDEYIYQVYIDADDNDATGYQVGSIGAEYLLEYHSGYIPKLYNYTGDGSSWSWSELAGEDYLYNPGRSSSVILLLHKSDMTDPPLHSSIALYGQTVNRSTLKDYTNPLVAPVPEQGLLASILILAVVAILVSRRNMAG